MDGNAYIDFCLGDTGAMTGHGPEATVQAITEQIRKGITLMLPYEDVILTMGGPEAPPVAPAPAPRAPFWRRALPWAAGVVFG